MTTETGVEPPAGGAVCPTCGNPVSAEARFCPHCGRTFAATTPPDVDIGGWLQMGWRLFASDVPLSIGLGLLVVVPAFGFWILAYFGFVAIMALLTAEPKGEPAAAAVVAIVLGLVLLVLGLVGPAFMGGVQACFLEGVRTGKLTAARLWDGFRNWWACTWVSAVLLLGMVLSFPCMCLLVGLVLVYALTALAWLAFFHIVDRGEGGVAALTFAWNAMRGRFWMMWVYALIVSAIMGAGGMAMYIGVVASFPIGIGAFAAAYEALRRKMEATG